MSRRVGFALVLVLALAGASTAALVLARDDEPAAVVPDADRAEGLTLVLVRAKGGPYGAVIGSSGSTEGALVVPNRIQVTIPGQGDATMREAFRLEPRQAATTVANLLGVWVDHYVVFGAKALAGLIDRAGGITVGDEVLGGDEAIDMLETSGEGATSAFSSIVGGVLQAGVAWEPPDVAKSDSPSSVLRVFEATAGAQAAALPVVEAAAGVFRAEPEAVRRTLVETFGGPDRETVSVIVLNGSGVPGVGELVAERIVPDGFRIVVSENASDFDHDETLVVVGSSGDVELGERVRDLLGTGSVNVSVSSGIAPVTVVVGKDFGK